MSHPGLYSQAQTRQLHCASWATIPFFGTKYCEIYHLLVQISMITVYIGVPPLQKAGVFKMIHAELKVFSIKLNGD